MPRPMQMPPADGMNPAMPVSMPVAGDPRPPVGMPVTVACMARIGMSAGVPVGMMPNAAQPDPIRLAAMPETSVCVAMIRRGFGGRLGGQVQTRALALGVAPVHPALNLAHPVAVIDGLFLLVILVVVVRGCGQVNRARYGCM